MSKFLAPAESAVSGTNAPSIEVRLPLRHRLFRLGCCLFFLGYVAVPLCRWFSIYGSSAAIATTGYALLLLLYTVLAAGGVYILAFRPTHVLFADRLVISQFPWDRKILFASPPRIEGDVLVINGKRRIHRAEATPESWRAIESQFGR